MMQNSNIQNRKEPYVYGLSGLAKLFDCSIQTAHKIKNSGSIPYFRIGKKFIFEVDKVMAAISVQESEVLNG